MITIKPNDNKCAIVHTPPSLLIFKTLIPLNESPTRGVIICSVSAQFGNDFLGLSNLKKYDNFDGTLENGVLSDFAHLPRERRSWLFTEKVMFHHR